MPPHHSSSGGASIARRGRRKAIHGYLAFFCLGWLILLYYYSSSFFTVFEPLILTPRLHTSPLGTHFSFVGNESLNGINSATAFVSGEGRKEDALRGIETSSFTSSKNGSLLPSRIRIDKKRRSIKLWRNDIKCKKYRIQFAQYKSLPICCLASFPGSGNTWLRRLIEEATGIFTGSLYNDGELYLWGYYGELDPWNAGTTIIQKSHERSKQMVETFDSRGILVVRNPYRAILSYHNFIFGGHQLYAPMYNYRRKDYPAFIQLQTKYWLETLIYWVTGGKRVLVIHYEHLRREPLKQLTKILKFFDIPVDEERLGCIKKHSFEKFQRRNEHFTESVVIFPQQTREKMDRAIRYTSYLLQKYGHEPLPLQFYEFYNGTSSDKITLIACGRNESQMECDHWVDQLNFKNRYFMKHVDNSSLESNDTRDGPNAFLKMYEAVSLNLAAGLMKLVTPNPMEKIMNDSLSHLDLEKRVEALEGDLDTFVDETSSHL